MEPSYRVRSVSAFSTTVSADLLIDVYVQAPAVVRQTKSETAATMATGGRTTVVDYHGKPVAELKNTKIHGQRSTVAHATQDHRSLRILRAGARVGFGAARAAGRVG